jgi:hypothetical protein
MKYVSIDIETLIGIYNNKVYICTAGNTIKFQLQNMTV